MLRCPHREGEAPKGPTRTRTAAPLLRCPHPRCGYPQTPAWSLGRCLSCWRFVWWEAEEALTFTTEL